MAQRLGWLVGLAGLGLVILRLGRVLEPAVDTPDWRVIVPAAAVGGVLVTWATVRLGPAKQAAAHFLGLAVVILRVTAPETLVWGIVPGAETPGAVAERLSYALDILRFGSPPVLAVAGLAALSAALLWGLGAAWGWSVANGRIWAGIIPSLTFYLYLSVVDRAPSSLAWNLSLVVVAGLGLVATSNLVPAGAGHLRNPDQAAQRRWQAGPATRLAFGAGAVALVGVSILGGMVPAGGAIDWRTSGGEGTGTGEGGFTASRFVNLRQSLVSLSDEPVFVAAVEPALPSGTAGYWRLLTLDEYTGDEWEAGDHDFGEVAPGAVDLPAQESDLITQDIRIESLGDDRLPSLYSPERLASDETVIRSGASLGTDGNLRISARTFDGLTYRVESTVPTLDLGQLASRDGELSPMFAEAADAGEVQLDPSLGEPAPRPDAIDSYLTLPAGLDPAVTELASEVTAGATTPFEAALLLEDFLQTFNYSTSVSTGHSSLDLSAWLTDPESPNYRTGYCEQFAAAMGVMGRILNLPTRVVIGFTPGEIVDTDEGPVHVVRERNAHAWVEVWLDGQGWVGFDPTPRSDGATTPLSDSLGFDPGSLDLTSSVSSEGQVPEDMMDFADGPRDVAIGLEGGAGGGDGGRPWIAWLVGVIVVLGALAFPAVKAARRRNRHRRAATGDIEAVWAEITDRLSDLGAGPVSHQTPVEYATATALELVPLAKAYSAAVYGNGRGTDAVRQMEAAERWIDDSFDRGERTRAIFSTRSLR